MPASRSAARTASLPSTTSPKWRSSAGGERDELVPHVDERHSRACAAAKLELEEAPVPGERVVDVVDLERDVVDADEAGHAPGRAAPTPRPWWLRRRPSSATRPCGGAWLPGSRAAPACSPRL